MLRNQKLHTAALQKNALLDSVDCRFFRKVLVTNSFRTARSFLNGEDPDIEEHQAIALLRLKHFARENDYRTCTGTMLDEFYIGAKKAAKEITKFNDVLDNEEWPFAFQAMRENILHTSCFDEEISLNS